VKFFLKQGNYGYRKQPISVCCKTGFWSYTNYHYGGVFGYTGYFDLFRGVVYGDKIHADTRVFSRYFDFVLADVVNKVFELSGKTAAGLNNGADFFSCPPFYGTVSS